MSENDTPGLLHAEGLQFGWPGQPPLFSDLSFDIGPGLSLVCGDDGAGKTSLLRVMAGALPAQRGRLRVGDVWLDEQPAVYRQNVLWIEPQSEGHEAHDALIAAAWLESLSEHYPRFNAEALADLVDGFSLAPHLDKPMYMLSTGSRRKVGLCAAFAAGALVTLIDQPFAALDGASIRFLRELLQDVANHPSRAWVLADYETPAGVTSRTVLALTPR